LFQIYFSPCKQPAVFTLMFFLIGSMNAEAMGSKPLPEKANNVILFIGDGMGPSLLSATRFQFKGKDGQLTLDQFPRLAKVKTYPKDYYITDSAAAGTAMAGGQKVHRGVIGQDSTASPKKYGAFTFGKDQPGNPLKSILELAHENGKKVGVVTTTEIYHATPAAFYAHQNDRSKHLEILDDLAVSPVDIALGGGAEKVNLKKRGLI
jgi:alkaline phosphatase